MNEKNNGKQAMVLVMGYILVIGFVGTSIGTTGLVQGQTATDDSQVTVNVQNTTVEIDNLTYIDSSGTNQEILADSGEGTEFGYSESVPQNTAGTDSIAFEGNITVYSNDTLDNIDTAEIDIYSDNHTKLGGTLGDRQVGTFYKTFDNSGNSWTGESHTESFTFNTSDTDFALRYGNFNVNATLSNDTDGQIHEVSFGNALDAQAYTVLTGMDDLSATIEPGQSVGINHMDLDVEFTNTNGQTPNDDVEVTANYAWTLSLSDATLTSNDSPDEIPANNKELLDPSGDPVEGTSSQLALEYTDTNVRPGTYSTTLTHTLSMQSSQD